MLHRIEPMLRAGTVRSREDLVQDLADLGEWDVILGNRIASGMEPAVIREAGEKVRLIEGWLDLQHEP